MSYIRGIAGQLDDGTSQNLSSTPEGHLEVAIHDPILPFGALHTESLTPIFQFDGVYGLNGNQVIAVSTLSGGATTSSNKMVVTSGTTIYSQGVITSRKRLHFNRASGLLWLRRQQQEHLVM